MALLVQRVSGAIHNGYYYPDVAGVGFSVNPFVWDHSIDPDAGFLRIVAGLGTRAVDRTEDDYTRLVALNNPKLRPEKSVDRIPDSHRSPTEVRFPNGVMPDSGLFVKNKEPPTKVKLPNPSKLEREVLPFITNDFATDAKFSKFVKFDRASLY